MLQLIVSLPALQTLLLLLLLLLLLH